MFSNAAKPIQPQKDTCNLRKSLDSWSDGRHQEARPPHQPCSSDEVEAPKFLVDQHDHGTCCLKGNETPPMTMGEKTQKRAVTKKRKEGCHKKTMAGGRGSTWWLLFTEGLRTSGPCWEITVNNKTKNIFTAAKFSFSIDF